MRRAGVLAILAGCALAAASGCSAQPAADSAATLSPSSVAGSSSPGAGTGSTPNAAANGNGGSTAQANNGTAGGTSNGAASHAVPWVASVASPYRASASSPAPPPPLPEYSGCTASQLSGRVGSSSSGAGNVYYYFFLTNSSSTSCTIANGPSSAVAYGTDGSQLTLSTAALNGFGSLAGPPVNLKPGQSAQAVSDSAEGMANCSDARSYTLDALAIGVGGSGSVHVSLPQGQSLTFDFCGSTLPMLLGFGAQDAGYSQPPQPLDVLTVGRSMPGTVGPGSTADYTVTLSNPTGSAVRLSPCPSYAESMIPAGQSANQASTTYYYYLNCKAAAEIPAHGSVTFAMEIPVPLSTGTARYSWQLQDTSVETAGQTTIGTA